MRTLKPLGLMFGPDVSTSDRATIGGMIGNNSAGARSLRYGKTVDHVPRDRCRPGRRHARRRSARSRDGELDAICARPDTVGQVHRVVRDTVAAAPRRPSGDRFPHILRRVSGYNLDEFVPGPAGPARRLARGALAVQPGEADRRLGGDAGGRRRRPS